MIVRRGQTPDTEGWDNLKSHLCITWPHMTGDAENISFYQSNVSFLPSRNLMNTIIYSISMLTCWAHKSAYNNINAIIL